MLLKESCNESFKESCNLSFLSSSLSSPSLSFLSLSGKNAIVTGARRGIGLQIVHALAENGANIWACARKRDEAKDEAFEAEMAKLAKGNNVQIKPIYFEMTDSGQIKNAVNEIRKSKLSIDILVNNAGMSYDALLPMLSMKKTRDLFEVNFFSHVYLTQLISRIMMKQGHGCIINISSYLAEDGNRGQSMYSASKAAMSAFTRSLAKELSEYGLRINAVAPGVVDTELLSSMTEEDYKKAMGRCFMHRPANPKEIGNVVAMLASDMSSYINGQIIRVDGCM